MTSAHAADPMFDANPRQISLLMARIYHRELALPDFQRNFVWDTRSTIELLRSVMSRYPAGTLLFWKQGGSDQRLAERSIEGAPVLAGHQPDELVLDGQQRLTALYRALYDRSEERFFVRMVKFIDSTDGRLLRTHEIDWDAAVFAVDMSARLRFDPDDLEWQFGEAAFPLADLEKFDQWLDRYARKNSTSIDAEDQIKQRFRDVRDAYLLPLRSYGFPVVQLASSTPLEAVCKIFETLNKTGEPLGAFDLLTAKFYPRGVNIRERWDEAKRTYAVLDQFDVDSYDLLQAISLRANNSAQRADILNRLTAEQVREHWSAVESGFAGVLDLLASECGVVHPRWLPYGMLLVPMAAVWNEIKTLRPLDKGIAQDRLRQYFWCTTFTTNFDQGANSQAGADYGRLKGWLFDDKAPAPEAVADFAFAEDTLRSAVVRRKALHAGVMALTIGKGAKDFHTGQKLTAQNITDKRVESHHVFPKAFLGARGLAGSELILNRALIDSETNKIIGRKAPSAYLAAMVGTYGPDKLADVLDSHAISSGPGTPLDTDDYEAFLNDRAQQLIELIEEATGQTVTRSIVE
jgi:hypothetical protein